MISTFTTNQEPNRVLCGDFNIVVEAIDSWRGEKATGDIFHTKEERKRMIELMATGLVDLFRIQNPNEQLFTWWDYRGGAFHRKQGLRIDLILGSEAILNRTKSHVIDRDYRKKHQELTASDHAPVFIDIE